MLTYFNARSCNVSLRDGEPEAKQISLVFFAFSSLCHPVWLWHYFLSSLQARESSINQIEGAWGSLLATPCPKPFESALLYHFIFILKDPSISCDDFVIRFVKKKSVMGWPSRRFCQQSLSFRLPTHHQSQKTLPLRSSWSRRNLPIARSCQVPQQGIVELWFVMLAFLSYFRLFPLAWRLFILYATQPMALARFVHSQPAKTSISRKVRKSAVLHIIY